MNYEYENMKHSITVCFLVERHGYLIDGSDGGISDSSQFYVPIIELGNTVPNVGDLVVNPFRSGEILEVKCKYFQPRDEPRQKDTAKIGRGGMEKVNHVGVYLVVERRPIDDEKEHFFMS